MFASKTSCFYQYPYLCNQIFAIRMFRPTLHVGILVYACQICQYDEIGENMCVYRNDLVTITKWIILAMIVVLRTEAVSREPI